MISADQIKTLRGKTGAGITDIKRALEESGGDLAKAEELIARKLGSAAAKKATRETGAGIVESYIHSNGRVGAMIEIFCETDFVGRNPQFKELAHDIAMHITAMSPQYLSLESVSSDVWEKQKSYYVEEVEKLNKPQEIQNQIVEGKLKAYFGAASLMEQPFIKEQDKTVNTVVKEAIGRFGENIKVGKFVRFEI